MKPWRRHFLFACLFGLMAFYAWEPAEIEAVPVAVQMEPLRKEASLLPMGLPGPRASCSNPTPVEPMSSDQTRRKADQYFNEHKEKWQLQPYHRYSQQENRTPLSTDYVYDFAQGALPIVGMRIRIRVDYQGNVEEVENTYRPLPEIDIDGEPRLTVAEAMETASGRYEASAQGAGTSSVIYVREGSNEGELSYVMPIRDRMLDARPGQLVVRASDGQVLSRTFGHSEAH